MHVGDIPFGMVVEVPDGIDGYSAATVTLKNPAGANVAGLTATLDPITDSVAINWPATSVLTVAGRWALRLTLTGTGRVTRLPEIPLIVQADDAGGWHTLDSARLIWPDAEHLSDVQLFELLNIARTDCMAFAPALLEGDIVPDSYRRAQLMQAANIMNSSAVDPATGEDGGTSYALKPFPLDWQIKQLLRPRTGKPIAL